MKMVKKMIVLLALVVVATAGIVSTASAVEVEGAAYIQVQDTYLWRGFNLNYDEDKELIEAGMDLYIGNLAFGLWSIYDSASDEGANTIVETDVWADYTFAPTEQLSLTVGNIYYGTQDPDFVTNEFYVIAAYDTMLAPSLSINYDWAEADGAGLFYIFNVGHTFELSEQFGLNLGAEVTFNQESDFLVGDYTDLHNGEASISVDWFASDNLIVTPMFRTSTPLSDDAEDIAGIDDENALSLALTFEF